MADEAEEAVDAKGSPADRLVRRETTAWFIAVFGVSVLYSVVRYHFVKELPWAHFPLFVLNKTIALAAVGFIASSYLVGRVFRWHNHDPQLRLVVIKYCGLMGFSLAAIHAFCSLALLPGTYFAAWYGADGKLGVHGELGLVTGAVALWALAFPAITTLPMMPKALGGWRWKRGQRMGYLALSLLLAHLVAFYFRDWLRPSGWSGLPPIGLIAALIALVPLTVKLLSMRGS